jgi:glycosyltransferase involved in cell wall biosynthesis
LIMDIIVVGQQPWDTDIGCNVKNIALEFAENNRVLYVNSPLDRISKLRGKNDKKIQKRIDVINGKQEGLEEVKPNLWVLYPDRMIESINWIKLGFLYNILNRWNNHLFAGSIKKALHHLGFENYLLFNDSDMFRSFYMDELLNPRLSIYYSRDYFQADHYFKHHGRRLEPQLIQKSDLCVANSPYLVDFCKQYNPYSYYVGQGCDLEMFMTADKQHIPADMINIKGPIIGYVGAIISSRLDINVISHIAETRPNLQVVLVGPEDEVFKQSRLHKLTNVHFLGSKNPEELPLYINNFDVCINPQILNDFTRGNYPRKIDEYLIMGKPVVATRTEAMMLFKDYTYLAENKEGYVKMIDKALQEDSIDAQQNRIGFASGHSWVNSVKAIYKAIDKVETKKAEDAKTIEFRSYTA